MKKYMNMTKMELKKLEKGKIIFLVFFIWWFLLYSCSSSVNKTGFQLEEFAIDDDRLNSIVDSVLDMHLAAMQSKEEVILTLNLSQQDSVLLFMFSLRNHHDLLYNYIFRENLRIIGYKNNGTTDILLLSDIDEISEFGEIFGKFIHPTGKTKTFSYIKFPNNLYNNGWPEFSLIYDPSYVLYRYINNDYTSPVLTTNPYMIYQTDSVLHCDSF